MAHFWYWLVLGVSAYLWGSIPYGFLIARMNGVDIRTVGSGNIGMTNVYRCVGKTAGIATFICDLFKGYAGAALLAPLLLRFISGPADTLAASVFAGALTVVGHNWTCFLGLKGGKGVASSLGLLIGLAPAAAGIAGLVFVVLFIAFRYISLSSIGAAASIIVSSWFLYKGAPLWFPGVLSLLGAIAILKHRSNITRLLAGTEPRFSFTRKGSQ